MTARKRKPIVGEALYELHLSRRNEASNFIPVTVSKVGRKYFTITRNVNGFKMDTEYHIDTWRQKDESFRIRKLYENEQERADEVEADEIYNSVRMYFTEYQGSPKLPLSVLRKIKAAITEKPAIAKSEGI
jgi:hypothetical protein